MADFDDPFFGRFNAHWWEDGGPDWDEEDEERLRELRQEQAKREAEDAAENKRRRYPPRCGYCASAFQDEVTYGDDDPECVGMPYIYEQGQYECGVEIDSRAIEWSNHGETPSTVRPWEDRVRGGQTNACRTIMELRWKTDAAGLERDRVDSRPLIEQLPIDAARKLQGERNEQLRREMWQRHLDRLEQTQEWVDRDNNTHLIDEMDWGYLRNLLSWLMEHSEFYVRVQSRLFWAAEAPESGGDADRAWRMELEALHEAEEKPHEWITKRPLYRRIKERIGEVAPPNRREAGYTFTPSPTPPPVPARS